MGKNTAKRFAVGTLIAAAAGYITGILTAPKSGKETREDIKGKAGEAYETAEKELGKLQNELGELIDQAKSGIGMLKEKSDKKLHEAVEKGQIARDKAAEILNGVKKRDSDDKDLKRAIDEAAKAIDHLKKFLKK